MKATHDEEHGRNIQPTDGTLAPQPSITAATEYT